MADDPVAVVRTMWEALGDNRMDDAIATMHRNVTWKMFSRPARSLYSGHDGIREFREQMNGIHGWSRTEIDDLSLDADGNVLVQGALVVHDEGREPFVKLAFEATCVVDDGMIISVDATEPGAAA